MFLQQSNAGHKFVVYTVLLISLAACASFAKNIYSEKFGPAEPREHLVQELPSEAIDYWQDVKPITDSRCLVCHGCYDAPCQLKMSSIEGIERGASKIKVYNPTRLTAAEPLRLHEDYQGVKQWREKGFYPVLNEFQSTSPEANTQASLLYRMLELKDKHPLPAQALLPEGMDVSLNRAESCPTIEEFDKYAEKNPSWGMPFGLPNLSDDEYLTLIKWLEQGAPYVARAPLEQVYQTEINKWEAWLNQDGYKAQLSARYIYEHLFLAHLYFDELSSDAGVPKYFKLVRSSTPPGEKIKQIVTRRPFDDPGVQRVYYRIVPDLETVVAKTHMPYKLDQARMQLWQELFIEADFEVDQLPGYDIEQAANPFKVFIDLPVRSRYRFMLAEAMFTVSGFIKGPVCKGQTALNVINDQFWVFFVNPDAPLYNHSESFLATQVDNLEMPAAKDNIYRPITNWNRFSKKEKAYIDAKLKFVEERVQQGLKLDINVVWDGDGSNANAGLTVFRHFDSATVKQGLLGPKPKTAWVINYHLLERIHYLLVAGYDVYGNIGHQLLTRTYMDFLRMEGESGFLMLLPDDKRDAELAYWYRNADDKVREFIQFDRVENLVPSNITYQTDDVKSELFDMLKARLAPVLNRHHELDAMQDQKLAKQLQALNTIEGEKLSQFSQNSVLEVQTESASVYFSLLKHNAHMNMTSLFSEQKNRVPTEDKLSVHPGIIGAYPNTYFKVSSQQLDNFIDDFAKASNNSESYSAFMELYGVRRTNQQFWPYSDRLHKNYKKQDPLEFGVLDYNRLENR
ncbi:fatty acid cis/trans isomerase [Agaribacterium haliotis]|uniref:fatty acid cis/trans isomerase n=1 Tax=Agaribacterium haliotis TaxID=2013869 RepID=UPI00195CC14F|nr:fatty acid cis/trans isomerase [Agaribacterium haliotis]